MATVHDVAAAVLDRTGPITSMKLQKLVYYTLAWHAVWDDEALFPERFQAWRNGPVCRELYELHKGQFQVSTWKYGHPETLEGNQIESIDVVVQTYGQLSAQQLSDLTHSERPWVEARGGLSPDDSSSVEISLESMVGYYSSLTERGVEIVPD